MLKALAFGLGVGAGVQAWRNWPANSLVTADSLAVVFCVGLVAAYFAGRARSRGHVSASATATAAAVSTSAAQATNSLNVFIAPGMGAGSTPTVVSVPTEDAPWMTAPDTTPQLTVDQLEGMDLEDLADALPDDFERA